jgi:hypothetical protein
MQDNKLQELQQTPIKPNVKLPPKTMPLRPAPPPPISGLNAGVADLMLQVRKKN